MPLTRTQRAAVVDALEQTDPTAAAALRELRSTVPQDYRNAVARVARKNPDLLRGEAAPPAPAPRRRAPIEVAPSVIAVDTAARAAAEPAVAVPPAKKKKATKKKGDDAE